MPRNKSKLAKQIFDQVATDATILLSTIYFAQLIVDTWPSEANESEEQAQARHQMATWVGFMVGIAATRLEAGLHQLQRHYQSKGKTTIANTYKRVRESFIDAVSGLGFSYLFLTQTIGDVIRFFGGPIYFFGSAAKGLFAGITIPTIFASFNTLFNYVYDSINELFDSKSAPSKLNNELCTLVSSITNLLQSGNEGNSANRLNELLNLSQIQSKELSRDEVIKITKELRSLLKNIDLNLYETNETAFRDLMKHAQGNLRFLYDGFSELIAVGGNAQVLGNVAPEVARAPNAVVKAITYPVIVIRELWAAFHATGFGLRISNSLANSALKLLPETWQGRGEKEALIQRDTENQTNQSKDSLGFEARAVGLASLVTLLAVTIPSLDSPEKIIIAVLALVAVFTMDAVFGLGITPSLDSCKGSCVNIMKKIGFNSEESQHSINPDPVQSASYQSPVVEHLSVQVGATTKELGKGLEQNSQLQQH